MLQKLLVKLFAAALFLGCLFCFNGALGQTVSINALTAGLTSSPMTPGNSQQALIGFSVQVSGGSLTFDQFNISCNKTSQNYIAVGKLYRSSNGNYSTGTNTFVANAVLSGGNITFTSLSQTINNTTNSYFFAADVTYSRSGIEYDVQFYINSGSFAHATNGNSYQAYSNYRGYNINNTSISVNNLTQGLASGSLIQGQTNLAVFGFSVAVTGLSTISQININTNNNNLGGYFVNIKLYRNTTSTYGTGTATQVGSVAINGTYLNVTSLTEAFASSTSGQTITEYYFLVVDYSNSSGSLPGALQCSFANGQSTSAFVQSYPSSSNLNTFSVTGNNFTMNSAGVSVSSQQNGLASTPIYGGQTNLAVFGFGVTVTGTSNITGININSSNGSLSTYIGNAKLYASTTNNYTTGSLTLVGNGTVNGSYINFTGISQTLSNTTKYYFLVVDDVYAGNNSSSVTFNFTSGQGTNAIVQSTPSSSYNTFSVTGTAFTLSPTSISMAGLTGGISGPDLYYGDTNKAVFGFSVTAAGAPTISTINIQSNNGNLSSYFTGKLYRNSTNTYGSGTATQVGTVAFNGSNVNITGLTETFTNGQTQNYFLVVDDIYYHATITPQVQFNINYGQQIVVLSSGQSFSNINYIGSGTYTLRRPAPTLTVTGINSAINGITQGSLSYGQTNIVLFGFKVQALGVLTISELRIQSNVGPNNFFASGRLYRSTTPYFANATQVSGSVAFNSETTISGMNEQYTTYNAPTTYYYFIVANLTATTYFTPGTFQYNFVNGQTTFIQSANPYTSFTNISTSNGTVFNIVNAYRWTGAISDDFSVAGNFTDLSGNPASVPGSGTVVQVGVVAYTRAPVVRNNITIGGITFGTQSTPTLTVNSGITLIMDRSLNLINSTTATINGPGAITITNAANSTIGAGSTLNLSNVALSNAGTFTAAPASVINLASNAAINNTGTFTLASNINGTAAIGPLSGSSAVTGNITAQRYVSGGSSVYRGYRLFSSPVYEATVSGNRVFGVAHTKNSAYITGTTGTAGGFDATASTPTIYLYREDKTPSSNPIGGNFRGINKINNTPAYDIGVDNESGNFNLPVGNGYMFFFRGDRATNASTSTTVVPDPVIFSQTGTLNTGTIVVKNWYTPTSSNLGYTGTGTGGNYTARGYNLVGNPYPATIDWNQFSSSNASAAIYGPHVGSTIYTYNSALKVYATYNGSVGTGNGSRYITSGQGFYVITDDATASLTFTEAAKAASQQVTGANLMMGAPVAETAETQFVRLQLSKDEASKEDMVVQFSKGANNGYLFNEDSPYMRGSSAVSISSVATDNKNIALAINKVPFPKTRTSIPFNVTVNATGIYQLKLTEAKNIPKMFEVWLMDNYKKDSLDIKNNATYNFNANTAEAATFGADRFTLVVRPNTAYSYHLLDFAATKQTTAVQLTWKAENEENYTYFTVERSTNGGKSFDVIGSAASKSLSTYSLQDKAPVTGENQYRLKQEDYFGTITYSKIIPVMYTPVKDIIADDRLVNVYPNPTNANLNIAIKTTSVNAVAYSISITNTTGRTVKTITSPQPAWQGNISDLLPGTYFIQVTNNKDNSVVGKSTFIKL